MTEIDTKTKILDAAEGLFAANGFGAVSLRAIIKEAGVNTASVHYHFGSKEGLIEAVLDRRAAPINKERLDLLDAIEDRHRGGPLPLNEVIEAFLAPVIRIHTAPRVERKLLAQLLGRAITSPGHSVSSSMRGVFSEVFERFSAAFVRALPDMRPDDVILRMYFVVGAMAFTVAGPHVEERNIPAGGEQDMDRTLEHLIEFCAAGMTAVGVGKD